MKKVNDKEDGQKMVMYVTKYGLTQGIIKVEGDYMVEHDMFRYQVKPDKPHTWMIPMFAHRLGKDFHRTLEQAQERVRLMRENKIASVQKLLNGLLEYTPKVVEM